MKRLEIQNRNPTLSERVMRSTEGSRIKEYA